MKKANKKTNPAYFEEIRKRPDIAFLATTSIESITEFLCKDCQKIVSSTAWEMRKAILKALWENPNPDAQNQEPERKP